MAQDTQTGGAPETKFSYFKSVRHIAFIFFIGFSFYLLISSIMLVFLTRPDKEVKVPHVVGKQFGDIYNNLSNKGLRPDVRFYDVFDVDDGFILSQHPSAGSIVAEGSRVKLLVSRSALHLTVPNLVGMELPFAVNKLRNQHVHDRTISVATGIVSYVPSEKSAANIVIDQSPKSGERITPGRRINLLVSAGKVDADMKMPEVTGQSIDLCIDLLLSKGVMVSQDIATVATPEQSGIVVSQTPAKDAPVKKGDIAVLRVNHFPMKERSYNAYDRIDWNIPSDEKEALYEAVIEDFGPKRIAFSRRMRPGEKISFVFSRTGDATIRILADKKSIKSFGVKFEGYR